MSSVDGFLEFTSPAGNLSFVRKSAVAAIYHDGTATRIYLGNVTAEGSHRGVGLVAREMPEVLMERLMIGDLTETADRLRVA